MHYYKKNIGDYAKKTGRLSMLQHGAYTLLIDACYDRERFPTLAEAIDWTWAFSKDEIEAVEFVLRRFFDLEDGVYVQSHIREEIGDYHAKSTTNKRIADDRESKRKANAATCERNVHASLPSVNEAPPNQEPITNNQEPSIKEANASLSGTTFPTCPYKKLIQLWAKHLPHLTQPRSWEGSRQASMKQRWIQAGKPSDYSPEGYATTEAGLKWWDSFFSYIASDTKLAVGFENNGRTWQPDLEWVVNASNFQKIIDGKYNK